MNTKKFIIAGVASFIAIFLFDMVWHGKLLVEQYQATSFLWRSPEEMQAYFNWAILLQAALGFAAAFIFTRHYENKGMKEGIRFGLMLGAVLGIMSFTMYAYMPIPMSLAIAWFVGSLIQGVLIGIVCSMTYKTA